MSSLKHLSKSVSSISGKLFERKFVTLGRLLQHWEIIVGKDLADKTSPLKVMYRKKDGKPHVGILISTDSSQAMLLHYRKDLILEKINQLLGDKTIHYLKFTDQAPVQKGMNKASLRRVDRRKSLTQDEEKDLSETLKDVEDDDLKDVLERFGKSLMLDTIKVETNTSNQNKNTDG